MNPEDVDILMKVIVAVCMGGLIGIERELAKKPAGIRTHMFVAGTAALIMSISSVLINEFAEIHGSVQSDPVRVIEAVIVGISFIGAGTVLKSEKDHSVYYLTTAASILFASAIGITIGLNRIVLAMFLTLLVILINSAVGGLEQKVLGKGKRETDNVHPGN